MTQPALIPRESTTPTKAPDRCAYCGAPIIRGYLFYFCTSCATPHRDVEEVLPPVEVIKPTEGELVRAKAPHVQTLFWTYFAVVLAAGVITFAVFQHREPGVQILLQTAALFVTTCIFAAMHWPSLAVQLRRFGLGNPAALAAFGILAPLLVVNYLYHGWIIRALEAHDKQPLVQLREGGFGEVGLIIFFCVFPAILEEIAFRGLVQHWLQVALKPWRAIAFAAFLFTILHFSILSFPYLFAVGVLLGWAKWKTGSLYPSMLLHFVHNLVVIELFAW